MPISRRSLLTALGIAVPLHLASRSGAAATNPAVATLRLHSFEEAVREAFAGAGRSSGQLQGQTPVTRRVEVGHCPELGAGVQGCHNDRPFAGFPAGRLRIVRCGAEPGPPRHGVRLYVSTLDITLGGVGGAPPNIAGRPLDFGSLPPAPSFL